MKKNIKFSILILGLISFYGNAQNVGINTPNPQGVLHVDGKRDNPTSGTTFTNAQVSNDVIVTANGNVGVGNINPKVKLDLRDANGANSEIGIGGTTLAANVAGQGAMRYNPTTKSMEYSDGTNWIRLELPITKAIVIATKTSSNNRCWNSGAFSSTLSTIPVNQQCYLTDWIKKYDNTNSFDGTTGIFTAPADGIYVFSYTTAINNTTITSTPAQYEHQYEVYAAGTTYANMNPDSSTMVLERSKCNNSFAAGTGSATTTVGGNCTTAFNLKKNQIVVMDLYIALGGSDKTLISTQGYNNLTIAQQ